MMGSKTWISCMMVCILWVYPHLYGLRFPTKNADQQFPDKPVSVRLLEEQSTALTAEPCECEFAHWRIHLCIEASSGTMATAEVAPTPAAAAAPLPPPTGSHCRPTGSQVGAVTATASESRALQTSDGGWRPHRRHERGASSESVQSDLDTFHPSQKS